MSAIVPVDKQKIIVRFEVSVCELVLNTSASFCATCYDIADKVVEAKMVYMNSEEYASWGDDDEYVIKFVADSLGFVLV